MLLATPPIVVLVLFNVFRIDLVAITVALIEEITITVVCNCFSTSPNAFAKSALFCSGKN